jgi:hypothetical protein
MMDEAEKEARKKKVEEIRRRLEEKKQDRTTNQVAGSAITLRGQVKNLNSKSANNSGTSTPIGRATSLTISSGSPRTESSLISNGTSNGNGNATTIASNASNENGLGSGPGGGKKEVKEVEEVEKLLARAADLLERSKKSQQEDAGVKVQLVPGNNKDKDNGKVEVVERRATETTATAAPVATRSNTKIAGLLSRFEDRKDEKVNVGTNGEREKEVDKAKEDKGSPELSKEKPESDVRAGEANGDNGKAGTKVTGGETKGEDNTAGKAQPVQQQEQQPVEPKDDKIPAVTVTTTSPEDKDKDTTAEPVQQQEQQPVEQSTADTKRDSGTVVLGLRKGSFQIGQKRQSASDLIALATTSTSASDDASPTTEATADGGAPSLPGEADTDRKETESLSSEEPESKTEDKSSTSTGATDESTSESEDELTEGGDTTVQGDVTKGNISGSTLRGWQIKSPTEKLKSMGRARSTLVLSSGRKTPPTVRKPTRERLSLEANVKFRLGDRTDSSDNLASMSSGVSTLGSLSDREESTDTESSDSSDEEDVLDQLGSAAAGPSEPRTDGQPQEGAQKQSESNPRGSTLLKMVFSLHTSISYY